MNPTSLKEIATMCAGTLAGKDSGISVSRINKDTRTLRPGDLYFALRGEHFDGNAFANQAVEAGAAGVVLDDARAASALPPDFPVIQVADGLIALQRLADAWRTRLSLKAVCVTGSNGKTSTKDFVSSILSRKFRTISTQGNLNNQIGVPLSILRATTGDEAAVWEIGMNHAGEIRPLAELCRPDLGIITNIGVAHIEYLGSRRAIALEKGDLFRTLPDDGLAIFPDQDDFADELEQLSRARVLRVGADGSPLRAEAVRVHAETTTFTLCLGDAKVPVTLPVPGRHMVSNALLAVAAGLEWGVSLEECAEGLSVAKLAGGRIEPVDKKGITFLNDSYNANPDSTVAALRLLGEWDCPAKRIAVLGVMGELGDYAGEGYRKVGVAAAENVDLVIAVGSELAGLVEVSSQKIPVCPAADIDDALRLLREFAAPGDKVLVKGSRSARMEQIIDQF